MKYVVSEDVHFEEATPRGFLAVDIPAGEIEPGDDSDERFVLEHKLIPDGLAARAETPAPVAPVPAAPEASAPAAEVAPEVPADTPAA